MTKRTQKPTGTDDKSACDTQMNAQRRCIVRFDGQFVTDVYYGEGWRDLADWLDEHREFLSGGMQNFVSNMVARKRRPSALQIATIVGLVSNVEFQIALDEHERAAQDRVSHEVQAEAEKEATESADNVVPLNRYRRGEG